MSIVEMKRVTVAGTTDDAPTLLDALQDLGCMHLIPLTESRPEGRTPDGSQRAREALRYLLGAPNRRRELRDDSGFRLGEVVDRALENRRRKVETEHQIDGLRQRILEVEPWGDFEFPPLEAIGGIRLWFYVVPSYRRGDLCPCDLPYEVVHHDGRHDYVVILSKTEPPVEAMPVPRSRVGTRSLSTLRRELEHLEDRMEDIQAERGALTRWIRQLLYHLNQADNEAARHQARGLGLEKDRVFVAQGWVPTTELPRLEARCTAMELACVAQDPEPEDEPPVLLANASFLAPGQDLVGFYQLPGYRDWDPSGLVYLAFVFFFAVILADAGYAALVGLITLLFWRQLGRSTTARRMRRTAASIALVGIGYGVLAGSYFGVELDDNSVLARVSVLEVDDFQVMLPLSIGVGIGHLVLANLVAAWVRRRSVTGLASMGWAVVLGGGFAAYLGQSVGVPILVAGLVVVFLFASERPVQRPADVAMRALDGFIALTGASRAFGDALSYLRLFALGLSSASLAATFNQLSADLMGTGHGIALVFALVVLIIGHGLNFVLGIVGGVVHGLRLNVIELYNWSVFGEGRPFKPLTKRTLEEVRGENRPQEI